MKNLSLAGVAKYLMFATAIMPLVVFQALPAPFVSSKAFFFRLVIEVALILLLIHKFVKPAPANGETDKQPGTKRFSELARNPLLIALGTFFVSAIISVFFAVNSFHAFWGDAERSDGVFNLLHYLAFLILAVFLFKERDWRTYIKITLGVGAIVVLFAWLQYLGVKLPFGLVKTDRPGSFLLNPAFLGAYILFLVFLAGYIFKSVRESRFWRWVLVIFMALSTLTLFLVNVRGVFIGLFAGVLFLLAWFAFRGVASQRRKYLSVLVLLILAIGIFSATRNAPLWKSIPGLNRLASISFNDSSVQTRLISLGSGWQAFLERPVFGWGPDNYNVAYNKYYNPKYALYEEAWFDRAHNKLADAAVMQGILGLVSYLAIFAVLIWVLILDSAPILAAAITAYFVQNLFLFDTPVSYLMFFMILAMAISKMADKSAVKSANGKLGGFGTFLSKAIVVRLVSALGVLTLIFLLYFFAFVPYRQASIFLRSVKTKTGQNILDASSDFLTPYNFLQPALRFQFLDLINVSNLVRNPNFIPLTDKAIGALDETATRESGYEPRNFILLGEVFTEKSKDDARFFKKSEEYLRQALLLSPKRQDIYYNLAFALAGQGRFEEAIKISREAVGLETGVAKAHFNLGMELALAGRQKWDEARKELAAAQDIGFVSFLPSDLQNIEVIYKEMLYRYALDKDRDRIIDVANRLTKIKPELKDDMQKVMGWASNGDWAALIDAVTKAAN